MKTSPVSRTGREHLHYVLEAREAFLLAYERLRALAAAAQSPAVLVAAISAYRRSVRMGPGASSSRA